MSVHFITFADGHLPKYKKSAETLIKAAQDFNIFTTTTIFTGKDLLADHVFMKRHNGWLTYGSRGFGYWIWKPYIILKALSLIQENDILVYLDACCSLHPEAVEEFVHYLQILCQNQSGALLFEYNQPIGTWCKMDLLHHFNATNIAAEKEVVSGVIFLRKTEKIRELYTLIYETCCNYHLLDDSPSIAENTPEFKEHRHDQSIMSIIFRLKQPESIYLLPKSLFFPSGITEEEKHMHPITVQSNGY